MPDTMPNAGFPALYSQPGKQMEARGSDEGIIVTFILVMRAF